jgi:hypothetical protein|nr:MAG TPA: Head Tail Connector Protein [Caudoviricetes sp.]
MMDIMSEKLRIVSIEELKLQMRVDFADEDQSILLYGCAAEDTVIDMTRRTLDELIEWDGRGFPSPLKVAILMLASHFYRNREPVSSIAQNMVPLSVAILVKPYVKLSERE